MDGAAIISAAQAVYQELIEGAGLDRRRRPKPPGTA